MKMHPIIAGFLSWALLTTISGCEEDVKPDPIPSDVIRQDTMCAIMADILYLEGARFKKLMEGDRMMTQQEKMELQSLLILKHHGKSFSEFDLSLVWYKRHPKRFLETYECILEKLSTRKAHLSGRSIAGKPEPRSQ